MTVLYLIADYQGEIISEFVTKVEIAVSAGVEWVQLRAKTATFETVKLLTEKLLQILPTTVPLIINDHLDVVQVTHVAGIHVGQNDIDVVTARAILGDEKIIGLSITEFSQLQHVEMNVVNYLGVGPIYATKTKTDATPAMGINQLIEINHSTEKPVIAIGGINQHNMAEISAINIAGIACSSAIMQADDIDQRVKQLRRQLNNETI